jgi:hypothetical protein
MIPFPPLVLQPMETGFLPGQLLDVVTELTEVVLEENAIMAEGLPAGIAANLDRKLELSDTYEDLCAEVIEGRRDSLAADPELARRLIMAVVRLREVTAENLVRLDAAMDASRRRVEAVMAAMRAEAGNAAPYGPGGAVPLGARLAAFSRDFHC